MKRKFLARLLSVLMLMTLLVCLPVSSSAAGEMAYNIYSDPVLKNTSGNFTSFMIDFRATDSAPYTYWALANFGMQITPETLKAYPQLSMGGGYAGLQARGNTQTRVGIMSFWHWEYLNEHNEKTELNATRLYPSGEDDPFGGEGTGMRSIQDYAWQDNQWYTMVLHSWQDSETDTTFAGQWFLDQKSGKWTLLTYYDTHLINSAFNGGMSLFQENYYTLSKDESREFNMKGMYVLDKKDATWKSLDTTVLSYGNGGADNKVGAHDFGVKENYFWGMAGGAVTDQEVYEANSTKRATLSISQPDTPSIGTPQLAELALSEGSNGYTLSWKLSQTSTPQLSYLVEIIDEKGEVILTKEATRPEISEVSLDTIDATDFLYRVTVTDIFGQQTTLEEETEYYYPQTGESSDYLLTDAGKELQIYDVDQNGSINIADVTALLNYLSQSCGHVAEKIHAVKPTCTQTGLTEGSYCSVCNEILKNQKRLPALGHDIIDLEAVAPTCTESGLTLGSGCSICGEIFTAQELIPATGHDYDPYSGICHCGDALAEVLNLTPYGTGWENWSDQTQFLIMAKLPLSFGLTNEWEITLIDTKGTSKTISLSPSSHYDFNTDTFLYRFQPCLEKSSNQFIPVAGESYRISVKLYSENTLQYVANGGENLWTVPTDFEPIVPKVEIITGDGFEIVDGVMEVTAQTSVIADSEADYGWYDYRDKVTEIVIADGIKEIGARAFSRFTNLEKITFGKDVTILNMDTMSYCSSLKTIVFKGKITYVGQGVVHLTANIKKITLTGQSKDEFLSLLTTAYNTAFTDSDIVWYIN